MPGTALALCPTLLHPNSPPFWRDNTQQPYRDRKKGRGGGVGRRKQPSTLGNCWEGGAGDQQGGGGGCPGRGSREHRR